MGCDIHAHIEIKLRGKWVHYSIPPIRRSYALFEKIAGVRGEESNAISPPRGLPADISDVTALCYSHEHLDAHSMTWLTRDEFVEFVKWADDPKNIQQDWRGQFHHQQIGYLCGNDFSKDNPVKDVQDIRFICWFDN